MAVFLAKKTDIAESERRRNNLLNGFDSVGKMLMITGGLLLAIGALLYFGGKFTGLGRLPGDIHIQRENFSFHFPIVTSLIISAILTILLNIFFRR